MPGEKKCSRVLKVLSGKKCSRCKDEKNSTVVDDTKILFLCALLFSPSVLAKYYGG